MSNYKNPYEFDVQFIMSQDPVSKKWKKKITFCGEINLGEFTGAFTESNFDMREMKGAIYSLVIPKIEKALLSQCSAYFDKLAESN